MTNEAPSQALGGWLVYLFVRCLKHLLLYLPLITPHLWYLRFISCVAHSQLLNIKQWQWGLERDRFEACEELQMSGLVACSIAYVTHVVYSNIWVTHQNM